MRETSFANHICDKGFVFRINLKLSQIIKKKDKPLNFKWAEDLNRHFSKRGIQMATKHMKRCSTGKWKSKPQQDIIYYHGFIKKTRDNKYW